jgi:hypothetical protein
VREFDDKNNYPLLDAISECGVVYQGPDPDLDKKDVWAVKCRPDGTEFYNGVINAFYVKNDWLWKYVQVRPKAVDEKFVVLNGKNYVEKRGGPKKFKMYGEMAFASTRYLYRDVDKGKKDLEWTTKICHKLIDFIIFYYTQEKPKTNVKGKMFFRDNDALYVVFPRIIDKIRSWSPWDQFRIMKDPYLPTSVILGKIESHPKLFLFSETSQSMITAPGLGLKTPLGVIAIQKSAFSQDVFERYKATEIKVLDADDRKRFVDQRRCEKLGIEPKASEDDV